MENSGGKVPPRRGTTRAEARIEEGTSGSWVRLKRWRGRAMAHLVLAEVDQASVTARSAHDVRMLRLVAIFVGVVGVVTVVVVGVAFGLLAGLLALVFGLPAIVLIAVLAADRLQRLRKLPSR